MSTPQCRRAVLIAPDSDERKARKALASAADEVVLDLEDAVAAAHKPVALQAATATGVGIEEAAVRALTTARQVMPSRLRHRLNALEFTAISSRPGNAAPVSPDVLIALSAAARAHEVLRFDYVSRCPTPDPSTDADPAAPRRVQPHHLVTSHGHWYLVAWDLEHDEWRLFRADRITPRTPTGPRFTPREMPGGNVAEYVSARFKGSEGANQWPCIGKVIVHRPASYVRHGHSPGFCYRYDDSHRCQPLGSTERLRPLGLGKAGRR